MMMWWHMPQIMKRLSIKHFIITDFAVGALTVYTMTSFSKSITSMVAGVVVGLLMNFTMMFLGTQWARERFDLNTPPPVPRLPGRRFFWHRK